MSKSASLVSRGRPGLFGARCDQLSIRCCHQSLLDFGQSHPLDIPNQTQLLQNPDAIPVGVDLVPGEAVGGRCRMRMVIVVPAFTKRQQSNPETISRKITRREPPCSPRMGGGIYQPGAMQQEYGAEEWAPKKPWKSADGEQRDTQNDLRDVVILGDPDMEFIFGKIGHVAGKRRRVVVHRLAHKDPSHMSPPFAIDWRVRIPLL